MQNRVGSAAIATCSLWTSLEAPQRPCVLELLQQHCSQKQQEVGGWG